MTRKDARGGESVRLLSLPPRVIAVVRETVPGVTAMLEGMSHIAIAFSLIPPAWRSMYGFAVAAACLAYSLYSECGVAAPGFESCDLGESNTQHR
jgi:hypothetical protein